MAQMALDEHVRWKALDVLEQRVEVNRACTVALLGPQRTTGFGEVMHRMDEEGWRQQSGEGGFARARGSSQRHTHERASGNLS
ncbi:MAG: hypothetical protein CM15mP18_0590 [Methanobacteriota archaeon]|nr:MAG: hypothetical protein CM15mP18_0590 [Euryarchaeota archaeon]